jgi:valyl-tRNA synthetase
MATIPDSPSLDGLEAEWDARWQERGVYRFDPSQSRSRIYSIDTPPPTISGSMHLGTAFGYVQVDAIARFHRMNGRTLFYPMGWDDNGLPTERRVQNHYGVRCDPSIPYDPDLEVTAVGNAKKTDERPVSRRNFVELCHRLTAEFEEAFEQQWRRLGLSVDWALTYATIGDRARRVAQRAFLSNLARGEAYASEAPSMWDIDFQTAVAQAEFEDREMPGAYYRITFARVSGGPPVEVETTRPELLPACVALVAHPDDERYQGLFGTEVTTPLFGVRVPVIAHKLAEPDKGSGIAMICTFGDATDVVWWRELQLPTRSIIGRDGRFQAETPRWLHDGSPYEQLAGLPPEQARKRIVSLLREPGTLIGEPRPITHPVKFYEKGERPLEIVTSRQWYIRNGARDESLREELIRLGRELQWHPDFMRLRYEHWVEGLNTDWLISRQRYFGVPFPVWYRISDSGETCWDDVIVAGESALPVDPQTDAPPGYTEDQRDKPGGFTGDPDVMDTWATSSLTPQIAGHWGDDPDLFERVFPYDLRPQGPEIIRTWLFATLLRSRFEHGGLPWQNVTINGWILDPDRKKMSKSVGNVLSPMPLAEQFGADGLRYWACRAAPGTDTAADTAQMKVGRRLATKVLNASKFVLSFDIADGAGGDVTEPLDLAMLRQLAEVIEDATASFRQYDHHRALERAETFFWRFCDDYLELVKGRAYAGGAARASAVIALRTALSVLQRLFAPFLPFVTEETWSWWREGSVHRAPWPSVHELPAGSDGGDPLTLDVASEVLSEIRKAKSTAKLSQRTEVPSTTVRDTGRRIAALRRAEPDLRRAGHLGDLVITEADALEVTVDLGVPASSG